MEFRKAVKINTAKVAQNAVRIAGIFSEIICAIVEKIVPADTSDKEDKSTPLIPIFES